MEFKDILDEIFELFWNIDDFLVIVSHIKSVGQLGLAKILFILRIFDIIHLQLFFIANFLDLFLILKLLKICIFFIDFIWKPVVVVFQLLSIFYF